VAGSGCMSEDLFDSSNSQLRRSFTKYVVASQDNLAIKRILDKSYCLPYTVSREALCRQEHAASHDAENALRLGPSSSVWMGSLKAAEILTKLQGAGRLTAKNTARGKSFEHVLLLSNCERCDSIGTDVGVDL
jgi:hypothetical protein